MDWPALDQAARAVSAFSQVRVALRMSVSLALSSQCAVIGRDAWSGR